MFLLAVLISSTKTRDAGTGRRKPPSLRSREGDGKWSKNCGFGSGSTLWSLCSHPPPASPFLAARLPPGMWPVGSHPRRWPRLRRALHLLELHLALGWPLLVLLAATSPASSSLCTSTEWQGCRACANPQRVCVPQSLPETALPHPKDVAGTPERGRGGL